MPPSAATQPPFSSNEIAAAWNIVRVILGYASQQLENCTALIVAHPKYSN
jgi:hypothetical protein